jgi:hypothetical protein
MAAIIGDSSEGKFANIFNILHRNSDNHIKSGSAEKITGRHPILFPEQENELCFRIFQLQDTEIPIITNAVSSNVYNYYEINRITKHFNVNENEHGKK